MERVVILLGARKGIVHAELASLEHTCRYCSPAEERPDLLGLDQASDQDHDQVACPFRCRSTPEAEAHASLPAVNHGAPVAADSLDRKSVV